MLVRNFVMFLSIVRCAFRRQYKHLEVLCLCCLLKAVGLGLEALRLCLSSHLLWLAVRLLAPHLKMLCMSLRRMSVQSATIMYCGSKKDCSP